MIIVLTGPTGSGKTKLAVSLAKKIDAEIVNGDAFQIYEELNIATAKPTKEEMGDVPHHLFSFVPLTSKYDVATYQKDARKVIKDILDRNKHVIIAGGTGLYIRAALFDFKFEEMPKLDMGKYEALSNEELFNELKKVDPDTAKEIHMNNRVRVLRALEIYLATGKTKSELIQDGNPKLLYDAKFFEIEADREEIYMKVENRVEEMFKSGLEEETLSLIKKYGRDIGAFQAIGVKEFFPYLDKQATLEEVKQSIKDATRHYIKRQETFFRHQFECIKIKTVEEIINNL